MEYQQYRDGKWETRERATYVAPSMEDWRRKIIVDPDDLVGKKAVVRLQPERGKPVAIERQSNKPKLGMIPLPNLKHIVDDLWLAKQSMVDTRVSYVVVDNYGSVNRTNIDTRLKAVQDEIKRRETVRKSDFVLDEDWDSDEPTTVQMGEAVFTPIDKVITDLRNQNEEDENMQTPLDAEFYRRQAANHLATAEKLEGMPLTDPFEPGQIISFTKTFGGQEYNFAAVKVDANWCLTGSEGARNYKTWTGLLDFVGIDSFHTIAVMVTTPELELKKWWAAKQKAKELDTKAAEVVADMNAKGQTFEGTVEAP
jgi:hypothetical protein